LSLQGHSPPLHEHPGGFQTSGPTAFWSSHPEGKRGRALGPLKRQVESAAARGEFLEIRHARRCSPRARIAVERTTRGTGAECGAGQNPGWGTEFARCQTTGQGIDKARGGMPTGTHAAVGPVTTSRVDRARVGMLSGAPTIR
jgi:hypothetical protein